MRNRTTPLVAAAAVTAASLTSSSPIVRAVSGDTAPPTPSTTEPTTPGTQPAPETTAPKTTTTTPETTSTTQPAPTTTTTTTPGPTTSTTGAPNSTTTTTTQPGATTSTTGAPESTAPESSAPTTSTTTTTTMPPGAQLGVQVPIGGDYGAILMTIRTLESGNNYTIPKNRGGASGAYQFIDRTWNNFGGYPSAYLAPPAVQDQKALADVQRFLAQWGGDVSMIPVMWYYPMAAYNPVLMDQVPMPGAGNTLTIRQYQYKWMKLYQRFSGKTFDMSLYEPVDIRDRIGLPPLVTGGLGPLEQVAFPAVGKTKIYVAPASDTPEVEPGKDAIILGRKLQPILTAFEGVVTAVEPGDPATGEVSVTVTDQLGRTYTYRGFNDGTVDESDTAHPALSLTANARVGVTVRAGTILGFMGTTDPLPELKPSSTIGDTAATAEQPVWPHLRLTIRDEHGVRIDAAKLVTEAQAREACRVSLGPWSMPVDSRFGNDPDYPKLDPITVDLDGGGSINIHPDGTVTGIGTGNLVLPDVGCDWIPAEEFGPGASGQPMPDDMVAPIELRIALFIQGVAAGSAQSPVAFR